MKPHVSFEARVIHVKSESEFADLVNSNDRIAVVKFGAKWCAPCQTLGPAFAAMAKANSQQAAFIEVDIDELPDLAKSYSIMGVPSIFIFSNGQLIKRVSTSVTPRSVKRLVREYL